MKSEKPAPTPRRFPPLYEKLIPIVLGVIGLAVVALLVIIVIVVSGSF